MKKTLSILLAALCIFSLAACGAKKEPAKLKVGATPSPHAEILEIVKDDLAKDGIELEIVVYNDYVQPNNAVESGDLDANYFQHTPYMEQFNDENGTHIVSAGIIHYEPLGVYSNKISSLDELKDGDLVLVPNDVTNEARALLLLEQEGVIKIKEGADLTATQLDIVDNPKNLVFQEVEAAQIPRSLEDAVCAVINGNYAIDAGFKASEAIAIEAADSVAADTYGNLIGVKSGNENNDNIKALVKALQSDEVKKYIEENYDGAVVAKF